MKRIILFLSLILVLVLCLIAMMSTVAFAADETTIDAAASEVIAPAGNDGGEETIVDNDAGGLEPAPSEFVDWGVLATYAGSLAMTIFITQMLKGRWPANWPTQILSYIIA